MGAGSKATPAEVVQRLHLAMNRHDLEAFLDCFDPGMEEVEEAGEDIDETVRRLAEGTRSQGE